jgi:hypothetical protein
MVNRQEWVIGIDFDNTIVSYDALLFTIAREQHLIDSAVNPGKKAIRDAIRLLPDGEMQWQTLQAAIYGPRIAGAVLIEGFWEFVMRCHKERLPVYIVSHKTEYANFGDTSTNLQQAALGWMAQNRFFDQDGKGLGLSKSQVFFGTTRQEKIDHIRRLGCTNFIDDLEEVFLEPDFPAQITKILYAPQSESVEAPMKSMPNMIVLQTWEQITANLFSG